MNECPKYKGLLSTYGTIDEGSPDGLFCPKCLTEYPFNKFALTTDDFYEEP